MRRLVLGLLVSSMLVGGCGGESPTGKKPETPAAAQGTTPPAPELLTREEAQTRLDAAARHVAEAGTGSYEVSFQGIPAEALVMYGSWNAASNASRSTMVMETGEGLAGVESRVVDETFYARLTLPGQEGDGCWMRPKVADIQETLGGLDVSSVGAKDSPYLAPLLDPVASASQQGANGALSMDVNLLIATSMMVPKVARTLVRDGLDGPAESVFSVDVVLTDEGTYDHVRIDVERITDALAAAGTLSAEQAEQFSMFGSEAVVDYDGFGVPTEISAPEKSFVLRIGHEFPSGCLPTA